MHKFSDTSKIREHTINDKSMNIQKEFVCGSKVQLLKLQINH